MGMRAIFFVTVTTAAILAALLLIYRRVLPPGAQIDFSAPTTIKQSNDSHAPEPVPQEPSAIPVSYSDSNARMQIRAVVLAAALFVAAIAAVLFAVNPAGDGNTIETPSLAERPSPTSQVTSGAGTPAAGSSSSPEPGPTSQPVGVDVSRLRLPTLGIDAPIITLGVDQTGTMQSPNNPTDVAWYNFSARPGEMSNVVMAGHLDYVNYGPAVFYRLKDARPGDEVELVLVDGSVARYRVEGVTTYDEATAPVLDIVGPTDVEMVTLITCGGSFDPLSREYDKRVVLRAERIYESAVTN